MYDQIAKLLWIVLWSTDKTVKEKTGKHIHQHAADFAVKCWERWTNWSRQYLDSHPNYKEIFIRATNIAAATKRAINMGMKFVRVEIFGLPVNSPSPIVIKIEDVPLDNIRGIQSRAKTNPILAMRY